MPHFDDTANLLEAMHAETSSENTRFMRRKPTVEVMATLKAMLHLASPSFSSWCDGLFTFIHHFSEHLDNKLFSGFAEKLRATIEAYLVTAFDGPFDEQRNTTCIQVSMMAHQSGVNPFIFMSALTRLAGGLIDFLRAHLAPDPTDLDVLSYFSRMLTLDLSVMFEALFRLDRDHHDALAHIDELTKFPDEKKLRKELQRRLAPQLPRTPIVVLALPKLPQLSEKLGNEATDLALQESALRLTAWEKQGWFIARARHNVFALLPPPNLTRTQLDVECENLRHAFDLPVHVEANDVQLEIAIGIVIPSSTETDPTNVLRQCEMALRHAAKNSESQAIYDASMERFSFEELALLKDLKTAIHTPQFQLHYQPQIDLTTGCVAGAEALARWVHPVNGFIPPGKFIALAEKTFLIHMLTTHLLTEAVRQSKAWEQAGIPLTVSVNIAPGILQDPHFPQQVKRLLENENLPAGLLAMEITESALLSNPERSTRVLSQLREAGIRVAIDDFGMGYSSMAFLRTLPVDEVKIDRSFVFGMLKDPRDEGIVEATIRLCRGLGISISAEGVEDQATLTRLREMGCQYAQGYIFARPMPPDQFEEWLHQGAKVPL